MAEWGPIAVRMGSRRCQIRSVLLFVRAAELRVCHSGLGGLAARLCKMFLISLYTAPEFRAVIDGSRIACTLGKNEALLGEVAGDASLDVLLAGLRRKRRRVCRIFRHQQFRPLWRRL